MKSSSNGFNPSRKFWSFDKNKKTKLISAIDCNFIETLYVNSGTFRCWEKTHHIQKQESNSIESILFRLYLEFNIFRILDMNNYISDHSVILQDLKLFNFPETLKTIIFDVKFLSRKEESVGVNIRPCLKEY